VQYLSRTSKLGKTFVQNKEDIKIFVQKKKIGTIFFQKKEDSKIFVENKEDRYNICPEKGR